MRFTTKLAAMAVATGLGVAALPQMSSAAPITVLALTQSAGGSPVTATVNGAQTQTTISATGVVVNIGTFDGAGTSISAFLNLSATSTAPVAVSGPILIQTYSGTFSVTSNANGSGVNYLTATSFNDFVFAVTGASSMTLSASTPPASAVTFTSSILAPDQLLEPRALSFSFANVVPPSGVCGTTLCGFSASITGTMSANAIPEPATLALLGAGLLGLAAVRRRNKIA